MIKYWSFAVSILGTFIVNTGHAETYTPHYAPTSSADEINGSKGANSARPFAAAARMSHKFYSGHIPVSEDSIVSACQLATPAANPWPEGCNPDGMNAALNQFNSWAFESYANTPERQQAALNRQLDALKLYGSPNIAPIYGQADHWTSVWKIETTATSTVQKVHYLDGGPGGQSDGGGSDYLDGFFAVAGRIWSSVYYYTIYSVPPSDSYYNKYLNLFEPPYTFSPSSFYKAQGALSPLRSHDIVTSALARERVMDALHLVDLEEDPELWTVFRGSQPSTPSLVNGVMPDGSAWNYYLVPFTNDQGRLMGAVLLDSQNLAFQMAWAAAGPVAFEGYSEEQARSKAMGALMAGESLGQGMLTWDPDGPASSPMQPYFDFPVYSRGGLQHSLRVRPNGVEDRGPCEITRRMRASACATP